MKKPFIILFILLSITCYSQQNFDLIPQLLSNDSSHFFDKYLNNATDYRIQIVYTQIDRDSLNKPKFKDYYYRVEENEYFYPASIVKLPFTIFALEQLQAKSLNINNKFCYLKDSSFCMNAQTIAQHINKALVVSDNHSANTLFEIATPSYLNFRMKELGFQQSRITQRFAKTDTILSRITKPFILLDSAGNIKYKQNEIFWKHASNPHFHSFKIGKGQFLNGHVLNKPYDFSYDNYVSLPEIHDFLKKIVLLDSSENGLLINNETLNFVRSQLSMYPKECKLNTFKPENGYYDACRKYLMFGTHNEEIDTNLRIFNKVGLAYGFVTDVAYIVDYKSNIEFMLSAVIYTNKDEILNDGKYDYETVAFPFMKQLGKLFYNFEKNRLKPNKAKLMKMRY